MAKLRIISDIHTEFHRDSGRAFVETLPDVPCDALVVAGDVGNSTTVLPFLRVLCERFRDLPVVYVPGNHEHYGTSIDQLRADLASVRSSIPNLIHLDNTLVEIADVKIAGGTLWFPDEPFNKIYQHSMPDFRSIKGLDPQVYAENRATRLFLERCGADVIVTHHLPCFAVVAPMWRGSNLNRFFVGADDATVAAAKPKAWLFGHTHEPTDMTHLGVRMIANPFGYPFESKGRFHDDLVVEV